MTRVGDLVQVPPVRTVIRLADLGDSELRRHMVETFIITGEVSFTLAGIFKNIAASHGRGFFVIGNYGSGKSHLLNILSLTISDTRAREEFKRTCRENAPENDELEGLLDRVNAINPMVVEISLVEHSNREYLEQVVLKSIAAKLSGQASPPGGEVHPEPGGIKGSPGTGNSSNAGSPAVTDDSDNRRDLQNLSNLSRKDAFSRVANLLRRQGCGGMVLLIDELSEFLRSKENARAYNEDVRFLQYLGEFAETIPAWIVATMQENIETTGALSGELLHKIKDRYPLRFQLSGQHVKEIVAGRLVRKTEQAAAILPEILGELENAFGRLPFSRDDFFNLYPVHPVTVDILDELRPLFSQHRGVIDFIHYRLKGDPGRKINPLLEQPASNLLTPDSIFDHFRDRLRETVETSPYSEQVYRYYEREAENIFEDRTDSETALRLLKLLILGALARAPKRFSTEELTRLLLIRYSDLESAVNYDYISEIMEKLNTHGAYISDETREGAATTYSIDLEADVALLVKKKLEAITASITEGDPRAIEALLHLADEPYLPLNLFLETAVHEEKISWQNTNRSGKLFFRSPVELSAPALDSLRDELYADETDFALFIVPPSTAGTGNEQDISLQDYYHKIDTKLRRCLGIWAPRNISTDEEGELRRIYAYILLENEYTADDSPAGKQVKKQLEQALNEEKSRVREIFRNAYFQGRILAGTSIPSPSSYGYLPLKDLVMNIASEILKERFPRHSEIYPKAEQFTGSLMQRTLDTLFSPRLEEENLERSTRMIIESYLLPLGLVKKKGQDYQLEINPKTSALAKDFLARIPEDGQISLQHLYRHLRKGPFGLNSTCFQVLGTAAILSGAVSAYQGGKKLNPSQVNYYRFWNIEAIGPGTLIRPELQKIMADLPFLPAKLRSGPLTFSSQQQAWEDVVSFKFEWHKKLAELNRKLEQLKDHPFFSSVNWSNLQKTAGRFNSFLDEIKQSYASREGLERFLAAARSSPLAIDDWKRLKALENFFEVDLPEVLHIGHYLKDRDLVVPAGENYDMLRGHYQALTDLLEEEAIFWEEKYRDSLKSEFSQFRKKYIKTYLEEHEASVGPDRIKPFRSILETKAYRLLEQLGRINAVVIEDDLVSINRLLAQPLERECREANELVLAERPTCSCGFTLGEKIELPAPLEIKKRIAGGIKAYLEVLREDAQQKKLMAHAEHLELVGRRREAQPLQELLRIDLETEGSRETEDPELVGRLEPLVNQATVNQVNRALTGDAMIAERSLETLEEILADRVFNSNQLEELFKRWLEGREEKTPDYIRVTRQKSRPTEKLNDESSKTLESGIENRDFLEERFPRLLPAAGSLGEDRIVALALLGGWLTAYIPTISAAGIEEKERTESELLFDRLLEEQYSGLAENWNKQRDELVKAGKQLMQDKEDLKGSSLERAAAEAVKIVSPGQLLDTVFSTGSRSFLRFENMLELLADEPFFPGFSREVSGKLAVKITAEESAPQLNIVTGMLREALKSGPAEMTGLTARHREEKHRSMETLHALAECNRILRETERQVQEPPANDRNWERLYQMLSPFEMLLGNLKQARVEFTIPDITLEKWQRLYTSLLEPFNRAFSTHVEKESPAPRQNLKELFRRLPGWFKKEKNCRNLYLIILDGARLDIWNQLMENLLDTRKRHFQVLREGLQWALLPTVTEAQLQPLKDSGMLGHILNMDEELTRELSSDPQSFFYAVDNRECLEGEHKPFKALKFNFIDEKIHSSREPLPGLFEELLMHGRKKLIPLLDYMPRESLLLLVSDHGFKTNHYHDRNNKEDPLYLHGEATFFEVLAPWALLKKK